MYRARFDCMMLGGIFSMWVINYQRGNEYFKTLLSPEMIFTKPFQVILFSFYMVYLVLSTIKPALYNNQFLSILSAFAIANLALNPDCIISLENRFLSFVGKISFGLYLLHKFPVKLMVLAARELQIKNLVLQNLFIYSTSVGLALLLAYLSFHYYETYFLRLKDKKFASSTSG